ncbi:regulatory protein GemA, partial [Aggregatibacter actinomycetemcomitans]|nr:regulatory protein GemA [Aggregatibacter actinomycetemcomitans]
MNNTTLATETQNVSTSQFVLFQLMKKRGFQVVGGRFKNGKRKSPPSSAHVSSNIVKKIRAKWLEMADAG